MKCHFVGMAEKSFATAAFLVLAACSGQGASDAENEDFLSSSSQEDVESSSSQRSLKESSSSTGRLQGSSSSVSNGLDFKSSSSVESSSSVKLEPPPDALTWSLPKDAYFNPDITYDSLVDPRDQKVYKTVKIGDQVWMAENLNYADSVAQPTLKGNMFCYGDKPENCEKAGRLYTWTAAMEVCPSGWHLPDKAEWDILFDVVGEGSGFAAAGMFLKSLEGWAGHGGHVDSYGFSIIPSYYGYFEGENYVENCSAAFWSSSEENDTSAYYLYLPHYNNAVYSNPSTKVTQASVRCLKGDSATVIYSSDSQPESSGSVINLKSWEEWDYPKEDFLNPEIDYGSMVDSRDQKVYKTVRIGEQVWMAENLNYDDSVTTVSLKGKSWCVGNNPTNCAFGGRLYTWAAAIDSAKWANDLSNPLDCGYGKKCDLSAPIQGICPEGWRLPTQDDFEKLLVYIDEEAVSGVTICKELKSRNGWYISKEYWHTGNGTDDYGFSAIPVGWWNHGAEDVGNEATFWHFSGGSSEKGHFMQLSYNDYMVGNFDGDSKEHGRSIRCLKNSD